MYLRPYCLLLGLLSASALAGPIDNTVPPCDADPATARPPCSMDNDSIVAPPPMPNSEESIITPPAPVEEGVGEPADSRIPPPRPEPHMPAPPKPEAPGPIPPPSPQARP